MRRNFFDTKSFLTRPGVGDMRARQTRFFVNVILLLCGIVMSGSGLLLQGHYHLQKNPAESLVMELNRTEWNAVHVWASVVFLFAVVYHIWVHRKWYRAVLRGKWISKYRLTLLMTALMLVVAVSGLIPLAIRSFEGSPAARFSLIEVHDKIAILFFIVLFGHAIKRRKWYRNAIKRE